MPLTMTGVRNLLIQATIVATLTGMTLTLAWVIQRLRAALPLLPRQRSRTSSWTWVTVVFVLITWAAANWICRDAYIEMRTRTGRRVGPPPTAQPTALPGLTFTEQMFLVTVINALLLGAIPVLLRASTPDLSEELGLTRERRRGAAATGAVAFFLVTPCVYAVNGVAQHFFETNKHPLELMLRKEMSPLGVVLAVVSAVVLAPAVEELIFRGILQAWLTRLFIDQARREQGGRIASPPPSGRPTNALPASSPEPSSAADHPDKAPRSAIDDSISWVEEDAESDPSARSADRFAIATTSFLFALVHAPQMPAPFAIFVLSLALGVLYQRTGSLLSCFTLHALFNGMSTFLLLVFST